MKEVYGISCELAGCVHRPIVDSESTTAGSGQPNLSQLYLSRLCLAKSAELNFFKMRVNKCLASDVRPVSWGKGWKLRQNMDTPARISPA